MGGGGRGRVIIKVSLKHSDNIMIYHSITGYRRKITSLKIIFRENNTWARVEMEFLFECSTRYLTSERSERSRCRVEHEK